MSYYKALEAAGAKVLEYKSFGSYQGTWVARVEYNGEVGWVQGAYGSCSGCDSFQAEFGWDERGHCDDHWEYDGDCGTCIAAAALYAVRLADFGGGYLHKLYSAEELAEQYEADCEWDDGARDIVAFVRNLIRTD